MGRSRGLAKIAVVVGVGLGLGASGCAPKPPGNGPPSTGATGPTVDQPPATPPDDTTPPPPPPTLPRCAPESGRCPRDLTPALHALGIEPVTVTDLSDAGEIVGMAVGPGGSAVGSYRLPADGKGRMLPAPTNDGAAVAAAVNAEGLVAGSESRPGGAHPVVWDERDRPTDLAARLPTFGGELVHGRASDVNDRGQVAGAYEIRFPAGRAALAFVWDAKADRVTALGADTLRPDALPADGPFTWEVSIGASGIVAGTYGPAGGFGSKAVRWLPGNDGTYRRQDLGPGSAGAVNAAGDVLGRSYERYVVWPAGSLAPVDLPTGDDYPFTLTNGTDINDRGEIVGWLNNTRDGWMRAVRWPARATAPPQILDGDGREVRAYAVNGNGTVVGLGEIDPDPGPALSVRVLLWAPAR